MLMLFLRACLPFLIHNKNIKRSSTLSMFSFCSGTLRTYHVFYLTQRGTLHGDAYSSVAQLVLPFAYQCT